MPTPNSTLQISILDSKLFTYGSQSYSEDNAFAPLIEHAARLGQPKPIRLYGYMLEDKPQFLSRLNNGSMLVIDTIAALCPRPSALGILDAVLAKGVRVWCADQGEFINDRIIMLKSCANAWSHLEDEIASRDKLLAAERTEHALAMANLAADTAARIFRDGAFGAAMSAVKAAINPEPQETNASA